MRRAVGPALLASIFGCFGCTSVDPGPNFSPVETSFDSDYFYCHVEPEFIFARGCGAGDPAKGETNSCHFTASAVSGMVLYDHPVVDCAGGDHPVDRTQIGTGSAAQSNLESVSFEMSKDYMSAPLFLRPSGGAGSSLPHPRAIFDPTDARVLLLLSTWAK